MKRVAQWAWIAVIGTALAMSWWSLDALALRYGVPQLLAAMVSITFDGAALVAGELALRRVAAADPTVVVKLFMVVMVGLSAWLSFENGLLLGYPLAVRVLFAAPSIVSGVLFELQLQQLYRVRLHQLNRVAPQLPSFGLLAWAFHPVQALRKVSAIAASRLRSLPVNVIDWEGAPSAIPEPAAIPPADRPVILAAPVEEPGNEAVAGEVAGTDADADSKAQVTQASRRGGRTPVPDELYLGRLRELVTANGGIVPSNREVARQLSIGQDRAGRLTKLLENDGRLSDAQRGVA